jgi:lysophospholipase L1-like esterase
MKIYQSVVLDHRPDIIFLFFGANDSVCEEVPQHVPLLEYKDNLSSMVEQAQSTLPYSTIIILSPPPVYEPLLEERNKEKKKKILSDRVCSRTREYVKACVEVGAKFNVDVIDNFTSMEGDSKNRSDYLRDGLHLNSKGNAKVYENVINLIEKKYKQLDPENMQMYQPHWSEIVANPDIL